MLCVYLNTNRNEHTKEEEEEEDEKQQQRVEKADKSRSKRTSRLVDMNDIFTHKHSRSNNNASQATHTIEVYMLSSSIAMSEPKKNDKNETIFIFNRFFGRNSCMNYNKCWVLLLVVVAAAILTNRQK